MQDHTPPASLDNAIALQKYGVGQPVRRKEDDTLVRGKGKYTDDFSLPGQAYLLDGPLLPCPWDHQGDRHGGRQGDAGRARRMDRRRSWRPWATSRFTCGLPLKNRDGSPLLQTNRPALATDKVRFVGDPVAFVVAETAAQARDAAEAVEVDIEPLPAVTDAAEAVQARRPAAL